MKKLAIVAAAAMLAAPAAFAAGPTGMLAGYFTNSELDVGPSDDGTGFGLRGWAMVSGPVFVHAEYQTTELDDSKIDLESVRLGGGYYAEMSKETGLYGKVEWLDLGSDLDQSGFGAHAGIVHHLMPNVHIGASLGYLSTDDTDGLEWSLGGGYGFTKELGVFVDYRSYAGSVDGGGDADITDLRAGVTYMFGG